MKFLDVLADALYPYPSHPTYTRRQEFDWSHFEFKKEERKSFYLLVGTTLVKVMLIATKFELRERGEIICRIIEIDGKPVSEEEAEANQEGLELEF